MAAGAIKAARGGWLGMAGGLQGASKGLSGEEEGVRGGGGGAPPGMPSQLPVDAESQTAADAAVVLDTQMS